MIIYNVTAKVDPIAIGWSIHEAWLEWMQQEHQHEVVSTGCFTHSQLLRLLDTDEKAGPTYVAQYFAVGLSDYDRYIQLHSGSIRQKAFDKWGDQFIVFRSIMQVVQ